eukprot:COSAG01_NODE_9857_length_2319_cov_2.044595_2_plen_114_part_00
MARGGGGGRARRGQQGVDDRGADRTRIRDRRCIASQQQSQHAAGQDRGRPVAASSICRILATMRRVACSIAMRARVHEAGGQEATFVSAVAVMIGFQRQNPQSALPGIKLHHK